MPINGLSEQVRTPRWAVIRLGYTKKGARGNYPSDADSFVIKREAGCDPELFQAIVAAYSGARIKEASEEVYSLGKNLRFMLPWEFDSVHDGREVSWELLNRAWGRSRIRCSGTGGGDEQGQVGEAWVRDPEYANELRRHHLLREERKGGFSATCLGPECPLWHSRRTKENTLPSCHREGRFSAELLFPGVDPAAKDYIRQIGWVQVSTGSFNGAVDIQSGLRMLRARAGRTANVPFTLARIARPISTPEGRVVKSTLAVKYDLPEALRFTLDASGTARATLPMAQRQEYLALALQEVQLAHVADIQPQPERRALPVAMPARPLIPALSASALDRDEAAGAAENRVDDATPAPPGGETPEGDGEEQVRVLVQDDVDALKQACGGTPGARETLTNFWRLVEASYEALGVPTDRTCGTWKDYPGRRPDAGVTASWLTTRHREWIEQALRDERGEQGAQATDEASSLEGELFDPAGEGA